MIKDYFVDGLIQLAIVLSLLRTDVTDYFNRDYFNYPEIQEIVLGQSFGYTQTNSHSNINRFERLTLHPKNLINEDHDISTFIQRFSGLDRTRGQPTNINAFLSDHETRPPMRVGGDLSTLPLTQNVDNDDDHVNGTSTDDSNASEVLSSVLENSELTKEDMDLIDVLWRQDIDLGVGREFFDVNLRHELEREREIELHKQRLQEYELELLEYNNNEKQGHNAQKWLSDNYYQDGETGEYIPNDVPHNLQETFTTDEQFFTFEEAFEILDRANSSTPPLEPPAIDTSPLPRISTITPNDPTQPVQSYPNITFTPQTESPFSNTYQTNYPVNNLEPFHTPFHFPPDDISSFTSSNFVPNGNFTPLEHFPNLTIPHMQNPAIYPAYSSHTQTHTQNITSQFTPAPAYAPFTPYSQTSPIGQLECPVVPLSTNQSFTFPDTICGGVDSFNGINTTSVNLTSTVLDHLSVEELSKVSDQSKSPESTTNASNGAIVDIPALSLTDGWDEILSILNLPDTEIRDVTDGLISNTSLSAVGGYDSYDNATAALAIANNDLASSPDMGIGDCFKFFNNLTSADADYLSSLGATTDNITNFMNMDQELDQDNRELRDDVSEDSAVSLGSHSPASHTHLSDVSTLRSESPYDSIIGATGGSDYRSDRKRMKSCSSDYPESYSSYEAGYDGHESNSSTGNSSDSGGSAGMQHNHTYPLKPGAEPRARANDRKRDNSEEDDDDDDITRDDERATKLNLPFTAKEIITSSVDQFNEMSSNKKLTKTQIQAMRDIRRRGKNKVAARNCRKRKMDEIFDLGDELGSLQAQKSSLQKEQSKMNKERVNLKKEYDKLYEAIFRSFRDRSGNAYDPEFYILEETPEGDVVVRQRSNTVSDKPSTTTSRKRKRDET